MKIKFNGNNIELTVNGRTVRGEYYYKNDNMFLQSKTGYELSILMKYKKAIKEELSK